MNYSYNQTIEFLMLIFGARDIPLFVRSREIIRVASFINSNERKFVWQFCVRFFNVLPYSYCSVINGASLTPKKEELFKCEIPESTARDFLQFVSEKPGEVEVAKKLEKILRALKGIDRKAYMLSKILESNAFPYRMPLDSHVASIGEFPILDKNSGFSEYLEPSFKAIDHLLLSRNDYFGDIELYFLVFSGEPLFFLTRLKYIFDFFRKKRLASISSDFVISRQIKSYAKSYYQDIDELHVVERSLRSEYSYIDSIMWHENDINAILSTVNCIILENCKEQTLSHLIFSRFLNNLRRGRIRSDALF